MEKTSRTMAARGPPLDLLPVVKAAAAFDSAWDDDPDSAETHEAHDADAWEALEGILHERMGWFGISEASRHLMLDGTVIYRARLEIGCPQEYEPPVTVAYLVTDKSPDELEAGFCHAP